MIAKTWVRSNLAIKMLLSLIFISKISFNKFLPLPHRFSFLVYQGGLHPFLNILLNFALGFLLFQGLKGQAKLSRLSPFYIIFLSALLIVLFMQSLVFTFVPGRFGFSFLELGAVLATFFLIGVFGVVIPQYLSEEDFVGFLQKWSGYLVVFSLLALVFLTSEVFKGGRFVGLFKHIPYMVTCANLAFVFSIGELFAPNKSKNQKWCAFIAVASFFTLLLTGTRSALGSSIFAFAIMLSLYRPLSLNGRFYKYSGLSLMTSVAVLFFIPILSYSMAVIKGERTLGLRAAQNGIESRWEEIERGLRIFDESPWLGHGLLSKFGAQSEFDIAHYNSFKDPHNLFISSGVVGGWPLLLLSIVSILLFAIACFKKILRGSHFEQVIGVYLLSHIPILLIYHAHLSLGGMADRLYWLAFGFLAAHNRAGASFRGNS